MTPFCPFIPASPLNTAKAWTVPPRRTEWAVSPRFIARLGTEGKAPFPLGRELDTTTRALKAAGHQRAESRVR